MNNRYIFTQICKFLAIYYAHSMPVARFRLILFLLALSVTVSSCLVVKSNPPAPRPAASSSKPLPPGQAKKMTGSQSAKPYAPGQQKKKH
jgi:hypothetical protein